MKIFNYPLWIFLVFLVNTTFAQESAELKKFDFPRRNSVYVQNFIIVPTINYDRIIPISDNFGLIPKVGFGYYDEIVPIFETSFFFGSNKHFGEIGGGYWAFEGAVLNINYRYMGKKGLLIKAGFAYIPGEEGFPLFGIGYSF